MKWGSDPTAQYTGGFTTTIYSFICVVGAPSHVADIQERPPQGPHPVSIPGPAKGVTAEVPSAALPIARSPQLFYCICLSRPPEHELDI